MAKRVGDRGDVASAVVSKGGDISAWIGGGLHLAGAVVGVSPTAVQWAGGDRPPEQIATRVIGEIRDSARLGDACGQMKRGQPRRRCGARERRASGFGARGLVAAGVVGIGRHVAIVIGTAGEITVDVIAEFASCRGDTGGCQPVDFADLWSALERRELVYLLLAKCVGDGPATVAVVVGDSCQIDTVTSPRLVVRLEC